MLKCFQDIEIILGSQSPRRKELLASLDLEFSVEVRSIDESIDETVVASEAAEYIALKKLDAYYEKSYFNKLIITADTVVVDSNNNVLGKPSTEQEAIEVIGRLSNHVHHVYTGVALKYQGRVKSFTCKTEVRFNELSSDEIAYYVKKYAPFDKAGSYGIQEWIGRIGVEQIVGSYENVMGLPTSKLYREIKNFIK